MKPLEELNRSSNFSPVPHLMASTAKGGKVELRLSSWQPCMHTYLRQYIMALFLRVAFDMTIFEVHNFGMLDE